MQPNKVKEIRPFSQMWFTILFDVENDSKEDNRDHRDEVKRFFDGLYSNIRTNQEDDAIKVIERATYLMI